MNKTKLRWKIYRKLRQEGKIAKKRGGYPLDYLLKIDQGISEETPNSDTQIDKIREIKRLSHEGIVQAFLQAKVNRGVSKERLAELATSLVSQIYTEVYAYA